MQHEHSLAQCRELIAQLNELIDGELAADLCAELRDHLADCPECSVVFDTISQTVQILHHLDDTPPPLPAELEARLLARFKPAHP